MGLGSPVLDRGFIGADHQGGVDAVPFHAADVEPYEPESQVVHHYVEAFPFTAEQPPVENVYHLVERARRFPWSVLLAAVGVLVTTATAGWALSTNAPSAATVTAVCAAVGSGVLLVVANLMDR